MNNLSALSGLVASYQQGFLAMHKAMAELNEKIQKLQSDSGSSPDRKDGKVDVAKLKQDIKVEMKKDIMKEIEGLIDTKISQALDKLLMAAVPAAPTGATVPSTSLPVVTEESSTISDDVVIEPPKPKPKKIVKKNQAAS